MKKILLIFSFLLVAWTAAFSQGTKIKLVQLQPCPDGADCVIITGPNGVQQYKPVTDICTACQDINTDTYLSDVQMGTQDWVFYISNQDGDIVNTLTVPAPNWSTDVDTTGLKDFVLGCLPDDDLIDGLAFNQSGNTVTLTVTTSDGGIFTDNFDISLFDGTVDTTGLKDFILDCIAYPTLTSTDGSVDLMTTTNTDGSTNYDLTVDLFKTDTTGLKELIAQCAADNDDLIDSYQITQSGSTYTVTIETSDGQTFTDDFNINLLNGGVDTTGLKQLILDCTATTSITSTDGSVDLNTTINPDGSTNYDLTVDLFATDTTGLKELIQGCINGTPDDVISDYEITQSGNMVTVTITTLDGQTFTDNFEISLFDGTVDTTGLKDFVLACIPDPVLFGNVDTTGLKEFVAQCAADNDDLIDNYEITQSGSTYTVTIETTDGQTYTDDFNVNLLNGGVDTTGLKALIQSCAPAPVLFDNVDTTGLKEFVEDCIPADIDTVVTGVSITEVDSTVTITVTNSAGETFSDDFTINLLNGGVDTTGLKDLIQSCVPAGGGSGCGATTAGAPVISTDMNGCQVTETTYTNLCGDFTVTDVDCAVQDIEYNQVNGDPCEDGMSMKWYGGDLVCQWDTICKSGQILTDSALYFVNYSIVNGDTLTLVDTTTIMYAPGYQSEACVENCPE